MSFRTFIKAIFVWSALCAGTGPFGVQAQSSARQVIITEFMASNNNTLRDEDGDSSVWIEIYNAGNAAIDLDGYFLTDRTNELTRWRIPSVVLAAGGPQDTNSYLLIFASGKNRTNDFTHLHTNFKLGASGGYLALLDPSTNVISEFFPNYPPQQTDVSYGRDATDPTALGYFPVPTPGTRNSISGPGFAPAVDFSRTSSAFATNSTPFALTLSTTLSNAAIYVTISPNQFAASVAPATNTLLYTGAILISNSVMIRARAFAPGLFPGPVRTETFIALSTETNVLNFVSDLPIMVLHNFGGGPVPAFSNQFVWVQTYEPEYGTSSLLGQPTLAERGILHLHGNSSLGAVKSSFFLEVQDESGADKDVPLLGLPEESDWVLHAQTPYEPGLLQNPVAFQIARDMGQYASRTRFVEVFLKDDVDTGPMNAADYNGIYLLEEKIKIAHNRVDIDPVRPADTAPPQLTGGYLFSFDNTPPGEGYFYAGGTVMVCVEPHYAELTSGTWVAQSNYIQQYFDGFGQSLASSNWTNGATGYPAWIDVTSWIDRHIHEILTMNGDAFGHSSYFYKPRNGPIRLGPAWDYDRSQGSTATMFPKTWYEPDYIARTWWQRLFQDPDFSQRWVERYRDFRKSPLSLTSIEARISQFAAQVHQAYPRDQARWVGSGLPYTAPRQTNGFGIGTYDTEVQWMKNWYSNRLDFLDAQFLAAPVLSSSGGSISPGFEVVITPASTPRTAVIYTLDGSDPRLPGGSVAATAISNRGPTTVRLSSNSRVVARSFNSAFTNLAPNLKTPWSSLIAATFITATPPLRITEIMYHPAPPPAGVAIDPENFQYIEVKNISDSSLNTAGYRISGGIDFVFGDLVLPAGGAAVVVKDLDAFQSRYGTNSPNISIAGVFAGNLNNGGDRLVLTGPLLEPVLDFSYDNIWYPSTDGFGFSLVIRDVSAPLDDWARPDAWRQSAFVGGSPGQVDPTPPPELPVFINEVLANPDTNAVPAQFDTIELFNPGDESADIGGWFLSDDFSIPKKFVISNGTCIQPHGYLTFKAVEFDNSNSPSALIPFGLGSNGDDAWLFSGDGYELTGYAHGFHFGASGKGVSFGRYLISSGEDHFVAQSAITLGAENAGPAIGPVIISEINYHPLDIVSSGIALNNTQDEFIELFNNCDSIVPLYDEDHPTNTWHLRGGVSFDFPSNATLSPGSHLLLVGFDPTTNAAATAAFRAHNYAPESVSLYGPWTGHLDNKGDDLQLLRPGIPGAQQLPYILVERVSFSDQAPWASGADGLGPTLQRISSSGYGNDPTNWIAAAPTPGTNLSMGDPPFIVQQPVDQLIASGRPATFTVIATGDAPLRYQWRYEGLPIAGATNASFNILHVRLTDAGVYTVLVYNGSGMTSATNFIVRTRVGLQFTAQATNRTVFQGISTTFLVSAIGTGTLDYQWRFNGAIISGATDPVLTISNPVGGNQGVHTVQVSDSYESITSDPATLLVITKPIITVQPLSQQAPEGGTVVFTVAASGPVPIGFRWRTNGSTFTNGLVIGSSNTSALVLRNVSSNFNTYRFTVAITNIAGQAPLSSTAILTVVADTDRDGLPDVWETNHVGFSATDASDATRDDDGDGMSNAAEFFAGTDYLDQASYLKLNATGAANTRLSFQAISNRTYTLLFSPTLDQPSWAKLADILARPTNRTEILIDTNRSVERYYRIVTPLQP